MDEATRRDLLARYEKAARTFLLGEDTLAVGLALMAEFARDAIAAGIEPGMFPEPPPYQPLNVEAVRQAVERIKAERGGS